MTAWSIDNARQTYNVAHWADGYFDINDQGHLVARSRQFKDHPGVDLAALAEEIKAIGLSLPVLVRVTDILHDRVDRLCGSFAQATGQMGYEGRYTAVYPIKVNQQRTVVEHILSHGGPRVGLEAGSKPELMVALAHARADDGVIICNGYKDREYVRLALIGRQLGHRIFLVVEKLSELNLIIDEAGALGVAPLLGVRVRLASLGKGKWQNTGGEKSKFGLSAEQVLTMVERLQAAGMLDCLQLAHCHLGSQLANIRDIQKGLREMGRYYAELRRLGAPIGTVDVGGGLGVDYEGTRSRSFCSMNYSVQEYANDVVHALWEICTEYELPHPDLITESGRALTAHHAVLMTNVIDIEQAPGIASATPPEDDAPLILHNLWNTLDSLSSRSALEAYHDAVHWLAESQAMFNLGVLDMAQRAKAEQYYYALCRRVVPLLQSGSRTQRGVLDELNEKLADKYFCNLSIFQSLPDIWAIEQIFPIMPLHRLDEPPTQRATLQDLTCDSDGRIDHYVDTDSVESTLPLHPLKPGEPYLLGFFMVGAYQEILGDLHNLFGDTHSVNLEFTQDGGHRLREPESGDSVDELLRYIHYSPGQLLESYRAKIEHSTLTKAQKRDYLEALETGLNGYTYLED